MSFVFVWACVLLTHAQDGAYVETEDFNLISLSDRRLVSSLLTGSEQASILDGATDLDESEIDEFTDNLLSERGVADCDLYIWTQSGIEALELSSYLDHFPKPEPGSVLTLRQFDSIDASDLQQYDQLGRIKCVQVDRIGLLAQSNGKEQNQVFREDSNKHKYQSIGTGVCRRVDATKDNLEMYVTTQAACEVACTIEASCLAFAWVSGQDRCFMYFQGPYLQTTGKKSRAECFLKPCEAVAEEFLPGVSMMSLQFFNTTADGSIHILEGGVQNAVIGEYWNTAMLSDMPAYGVNPKNVQDIQKSLVFAKAHCLQVTVKNHGHNFLGQAAGAGTMLIWMGDNFQGVEVQRGEYKDSCGTSWGNVVHAQGGSTFLGLFETLNKTGREFHSVGGTCDTVGAAGGWVLGSSLSFEFGRSLGLGSDVVIDFEVVLADGRHIVVDACSEPELFQAMRGGGGGWAIIISLHYRLFDGGPVSSVVAGFNRTLHNAPTDPWWEWLVKWAPTVDERWTVTLPWDAGIHSADNGFMLWASYRGPKVEAENSLVFQELKALYDAVPVEARLDHRINWGISLSGVEGELLTEWPSFAEFKLRETIPSKMLQGNMSDLSNPGSYLGNRLMPRSFLVEQPQAAVQFFKSLENRMCPLGILYPLGGKIAEYDRDNVLTSVTPNVRDAIYQLGICSEELMEDFNTLFPNDVGGSLINHAGSYQRDQEDWYHTIWGEKKYADLLELKKKYDPDTRFYCPRCIGVFE